MHVAGKFSKQDRRNAFSVSKTGGKKIHDKSVFRRKKSGKISFSPAAKTEKKICRERERQKNWLTYRERMWVRRFWTRGRFCYQFASPVRVSGEGRGRGLVFQGQYLVFQSGVARFIPHTQIEAFVLFMLFFVWGLGLCTFCRLFLNWERGGLTHNIFLSTLMRCHTSELFADICRSAMTARPTPAVPPVT